MEQGYCRRCGQSLFGIQGVLDGRLDESRKRLEAAEKWLKAGTTTLSVFISIALLISVLGVVIGNPNLSLIAMINVLAGAIIGSPFTCIGISRLLKAKRLISQPPVDSRPGIQGTSLRTGAIAQTVKLPERINQGSVTEHTTLSLSPAEPAHQSQRDTHR